MDFAISLFDRDECFLGLLQNDAGGRILTARHDEAAHLLRFSLAGAAPGGVREGHYAGFHDMDHFFQLFEIKRVEENHTALGLTCDVYAEHVLYELLSHIVTDVSLTDTTAVTAASSVLAGSRWQCPTTRNFGVQSVDFYDESALACLNRIAELWGVALRFRLILTKNRITGREVDLIDRLGTDTGRRFSFDKNLTAVTREVDTRGVVTALYGRGRTLRVKEMPDGTPARAERLSFSEAAWHTPGDPAAKPAGQEWVGDPEALSQWGYGPAGQKRHRFGLCVFSDVEDPDELLRKTWEELGARKVPRVTYTMAAIDLERISGEAGDAVRMGDTVTVVDDAFSPALELTARVIAIQRDWLSPDDTRITLGNAAPAVGSLMARLESETRRLLEKESLYDDTSLANGPGSAISTDRLEGQINLLTNMLLASGSFAAATPVEGSGILLENNNASSPDYGALYLGPGVLAVASAKTGGRWQWRTFGTGRGFTADEIVAGSLDAALIRTGLLQSQNGSSFINLNTGAFGFGGGKITGGADGDVRIQGYLTAEKNGKKVFISADDIGTPSLGFEVEGDGAGYVYAATWDDFRIEAGWDLTLTAEHILKLDTPAIRAPNGQNGYSGTLVIGGRTLSFSGGLLCGVS